MKPYFAITLLAGLISATVVSINSFAGNSGGGGNATPAHIATALDIRRGISAERIVFKYYLANLKNRLRPSGPTDPVEKRIYSLYFDPKQESPFETLKKVKIQVNDSSPCYYRNDKTPQDASADATTNTICMSIPRILSRHFDHSVLAIKLTSLFAHEFAHLRGLTHSPSDEKFALKAQIYMFEPNMYGLSYSDLDSTIMQTKSDLTDWLNTETNRVQMIKATSNFFDFCQSLEQATSFDDINRVLVIENDIQAQQMSMLFTPESVQAKSIAALLIISNTFNACDTVSPQKYFWKKAFGGGSSPLIAVSAALSANGSTEGFSTAEFKYWATVLMPLIKFGPQNRTLVLSELKRGLQIFKSGLDEELAVPTPDNCQLGKAAGSWTCKGD